MQSVSNKMYNAIYSCQKPEPMKYIDDRLFHQWGFHSILEDNPLEDEALGIQGVLKKTTFSTPNIGGKGFLSNKLVTLMLIKENNIF